MYSYATQGAVQHPDAFHIAADIAEYCVECTTTNILTLNAGRKANGLYVYFVRPMRN